MPLMCQMTDGQLKTLRTRNEVLAAAGDEPALLLPCKINNEEHRRAYAEADRIAERMASASCVGLWARFGL